MDVNEVRDKYEHFVKIVEEENRSTANEIEEHQIPSDDFLSDIGRPRHEYVAALRLCMKLKRVLKSDLIESLIEYGKSSGFEIFPVVEGDVLRIMNEKCSSLAFYWPKDNRKPEAVAIGYDYNVIKRGKVSGFLHTDFVEVMSIESDDGDFTMTVPEWTKFMRQAEKYLSRAETQQSLDD